MRKAVLALFLASPAGAAETLPYGESPLAQAVETQDPALVADLLRHGARPNLADVQGFTPLALACEHGDPAIVGQLLDAKADVKHAGPGGVSPLAICARFAGSGTVSRMLAMGAPADAVDADGLTPLMWAASKGDVATIALLLKAGAAPNRVSQAGFSPLFFAIKSGVPEASRVLLDAGADAAFRGPENTSAVQLAAYQANWGAAAMLVEKGGVDLKEPDREGRPLLHVAAAGGDLALVRLLLAKGADAKMLSGPSKIQWVTEANFGIAPPPVPPMPPLFFAARAGHVEIMRALVAAGADPQFVADNGANIVIAAARGPSAEALDYALSLAPDANVTDKGGMTPLHYVLVANLHLVQPGLEDMLRVLAGHGARIDIATKGKKGEGMTALAMADGGLAPVKAAFHKVFTPAKP